MVINRAPPLINMCGYYWPIESLTHHYKCKYQNLWYGICITKHKQRCTTVLILRTNLVTCIKGCCKVRQDCDEDSNSEQLSHLVFNGNHQKEIQTVKGDERKKIVVLRPWCRIGMAPSPTVLTFWSRQTARLCFHPAHIASSRSCHLSCRHVDTFQFPDAPDPPVTTKTLKLSPSIALGPDRTSNRSTWMGPPICQPLCHHLGWFFFFITFPSPH